MKAENLPKRKKKLSELTSISLLQPEAGVATRLQAERSGDRIPVEARDLLSPKCPDRLSGPPIPWVPGAKRPGRKVNHLPSSSAEVKNEWS
jgi:hypothetical protein